MDAKLRSAGVCPAAKSFLRLRPDNTTSMHHQRILTEHKKRKKNKPIPIPFLDWGIYWQWRTPKFVIFLWLGPKTCLWPKKEKTAWVWFASSFVRIFCGHKIIFIVYVIRELLVQKPVHKTWPFLFRFKVLCTSGEYEVPIFPPMPSCCTFYGSSRASLAQLCALFSAF